MKKREKDFLSRIKYFLRDFFIVSFPSFLKTFGQKQVFVPLVIDFLFFLFAVGAAYLFSFLTASFQSSEFLFASSLSAVSFSSYSTFLMKILFVIFLYVVVLLFLYTLSKYFVYRFLTKKKISLRAYFSYALTTFVIGIVTLVFLLLSGLIFTSSVLSFVLFVFLVYLLFFTTLFEISYFKKPKVFASLSSAFGVSWKKIYWLVFLGILFLLGYGVLHWLWQFLFFAQNITFIRYLSLLFEMLSLFYLASWMRWWLFKRLSKKYE